MRCPTPDLQSQLWLGKVQNSSCPSSRPYEKTRRSPQKVAAILRRALQACAVPEQCRQIATDRNALSHHVGACAHVFKSTTLLSQRVGASPCTHVHSDRNAVIQVLITHTCMSTHGESVARPVSIGGARRDARANWGLEGTTKTMPCLALLGWIGPRESAKRMMRLLVRQPMCKKPLTHCIVIISHVACHQDSSLDGAGWFRSPMCSIHQPRKFLAE